MIVLSEPVGFCFLRMSCSGCPEQEVGPVSKWAACVSTRPIGAWQQGMLSGGSVPQVCAEKSLQELNCSV